MSIVRTRYRLGVILALAAVAIFALLRLAGGSEASSEAATLPAAEASATEAVGGVTPPPAPTPDPDHSAEAPVPTTAPPVLHATLSPGDAETVGVGMPAVVTFDRAIGEGDRRAVEERLSVSAEPAVEGAWRWITPARAHWRPAVYWQPGTVVTVHSDLRGLVVGPATGADERSVRFRIGAAHISTVDVATHQMTVTENGSVVRVVPVSTGRVKYQTHNGVHLALEKARTQIMDSSTVGIPLNSPGGYRRKVAWAIRVSWSGTFVHAAPWSVRSQGERNVSHGCINAGPADARWFFDFTRRGDIVDVVNSPRPPKLSDPGMADWNMTFEQWKARA